MKSDCEWTLTNRFLERAIRFEPGEGLYTQAWVLRQTGTDYLEQARNAHRRRGEYAFAANGQWMTSTRMQKDEWGMSQYAVHEIVFQIPGMDPIRGHISRWGAEVILMANFSNRHGLISYKRAD